jgi:hypothetical protein
VTHVTAVLPAKWCNRLFTTEMLYRTVFTICGTVSVLAGLLSLVFSLLGAESAAALFVSSVVMIVSGLLILCSGFLPKSWLPRVNSENALTMGFTFLVGFAAVGLLLRAALLSGTFYPPQGLAYYLCPGCVPAGMFAGGSLLSQFWVPALVNALIFGTIGGVIGTAFGATRE